jgi:hypothetical protein
VTVGTLAYRPLPEIPSLLRRSAVVLIVFISLQVFFSPQWIIWLTPLLAPLAQRDRSLIPWLVAFDLIMFLSFPVVFFHHHLFGLGDVATKGLLYLRIILPAIITYQLIRAEYGRTDLTWGRLAPQS